MKLDVSLVPPSGKSLSQSSKAQILAYHPEGSPPPRPGRPAGRLVGKVTVNTRARGPGTPRAGSSGQPEDDVPALPGDDAPHEHDVPQVVEVGVVGDPVAHVAPMVSKILPGRSSPFSRRPLDALELLGQGLRPDRAGCPRLRARRIAAFWEKYSPPQPWSPDHSSIGRLGLKSTGGKASSLSQLVMSPVGGDVASGLARAEGDAEDLVSFERSWTPPAPPPRRRWPRRGDAPPAPSGGQEQVRIRVSKQVPGTARKREARHDPVVT